MNPPRWMKPAALVLPLGLTAAFALPRVELAFGPEEGAELAKSFEVELAFALEDLVVMMGGNELPIPFSELDPSEREGDATITLEVTDRFEGVADGRPSDLLRTYETVAFEGEIAGDTESDSFDELEGVQVRFRWDEETETYERSFEGGEADEEILPALAVDMDLRMLLPSDDVEEGDTWEVPITALGPMFVPGFDVRGAIEADAEGFDDIPVELADVFEEAFGDAVLECTYEGPAGDDDGLLGRIALSMEVAPTLDLVGAIMVALEEEMDGSQEVTELTVDLDLVCNGELLWNLDKGHFDEFELECEMTIDVFAVAEIDFNGTPMEAEAEAELSGSLTISASAE